MAADYATKRVDELERETAILRAERDALRARPAVPEEVVALVRAATPIVDSMMLDDGIGWVFSASPNDVAALRETLANAKDALAAEAALSAPPSPVVTGKPDCESGKHQPWCRHAPAEQEDIDPTECEECAPVVEAADPCPVDAQQLDMWSRGKIGTTYAMARTVAWLVRREQARDAKGGDVSDPCRICGNPAGRKAARRVPS